MSRSLAVSLLFLGLLGLWLHVERRASDKPAASQDLIANERRRGDDLDEQRRRRDVFVRKMDAVCEALDQGTISLRLAATAIEAESQRAYPELLNWLAVAYSGVSDQERIARSLVCRSHINQERFGTPALAQARQRIEREFRGLRE